MELLLPVPWLRDKLSCSLLFAWLTPAHALLVFSYSQLFFFFPFHIQFTRSKGLVQAEL